MQENHPQREPPAVPQLPVVCRRFQVTTPQPALRVYQHSGLTPSRHVQQNPLAVPDPGVFDENPTA